MKSRWGVVVVAVAILFAVAAAFGSRSDAASTKSAPLLRVAINSPVSVLDTAKEAGDFGLSVDLLGLETLVKLAADGSVVPNLAQSVTQPGRAIYIYHLIARSRAVISR